ncbi:FUSC family protein [Enterococcus faecalis]
MKIGPFRLGMRTAKTALAVVACILLFQLFHRGSPMIACLAAVFSLRQDFNTSLSFGKSRVIGNTLGGVLAIVFVLAKTTFSNYFLVELFLLPALVVFVIVLSDGINNNAGIISAVATLLMISLSVPEGDSFLYAIGRVLDTFIGTFIAIGINFFLRPKPVEETREIEEDLAELEQKEKELEALKAAINQRLAKEKKKQE